MFKVFNLEIPGQKKSRLQEALYDACTKGNLDQVRNLIQKGIDLNWQLKYGETALQLASAYVNQLDKILGESALIKASRCGHFQICALLIQKGANVNQASKVGGLNALIKASCRGHFQICDLLIQNGANVNQVDKNLGQNALIYASRQGHFEICDLLVQKGANVNQLSKFGGWNALREAICQSNIKICYLLIQKGVNVKHEYYGGWTALHFASLRGLTGVCDFLIQKGADVNLQNKDGETALHYAAVINDINICNLLIQYGAAINLENKNGETALQLANLKDQAEVRDLLVKSGASLKPILNKEQPQIILDNKDPQNIAHNDPNAPSTNKEIESIRCQDSLKGNLNLLEPNLEMRKLCFLHNEKFDLATDPFHDSFSSFLDSNYDIKDHQYFNTQSLFWTDQTGLTQFFSCVIKESQNVLIDESDHSIIYEVDDSIVQEYQQKFLYESNQSRMIEPVTFQKGQSVVKAIKKGVDKYYEDPEYLALMQTGFHPNIVTCFCAGVYKGQWHMILEKCQMNITYLIKEKQQAFYNNDRTTNLAIEICKEVLEGLVYIYEKNCVHRNLKPSNILINNDAKLKEPKFGFDNISKRGFSKISDMRLAEMLINNDNEHLQQCQQADIQDLGYNFLFILTGAKHSFRSISEDIRIQGESLDLLSKNPEGQNLVQLMLDRDPNNRPSFKFIKDHCLFWTFQEKLIYFQNISDQLATKPAIDPDVVRLNNLGPQSFGATWYNTFPQIYTVWAQGKSTNYDFSSLKNLLRSIRNYCHHSQESNFDQGVKAYIERTLPDYPCGITREEKIFRSYQSLFPKLLITIIDNY